MGKGREVVLGRHEEEILATLARCVRLFTVDQIARTWFTSRRVAQARMRTLEAAGYLHMRDALLHPELALETPVVVWKPAQPQPPFGRIAHRLRTRWTGTVAAETVVVISEDAATQFGGLPAPPLRTDELTHDAHLAAVYLRYRRAAPELASTWIGERIIKNTRQIRSGPVPDASVRDGRRRRYIEFAGAYPKGRLEAFHEFCAASETTYELW
jgi:hypothetical protein